MRVNTWNSQGDFFSTDYPPTGRHREKLGFWTQQATVGQASVTCIQEGGSDRPIGDHGLFHIIQGPPVGAFNERCTNYLITHNVGLEPVMILDLDGGPIVGGGNAGRAPAAGIIGRHLYVSWHSTANTRYNSDTMDLIRALENGSLDDGVRNPVLVRCLVEEGAIDTIIIGGDFNTTPGELQRSLNSLTSRRLTLRGNQQQNFSRQVISCGQPTHHGPNNALSELDFFVVMRANLVTGQTIQRVEAVDATGQRLSDHDMVTLDIP